jgi:hypothetical protein
MGEEGKGRSVMPWRFPVWARAALAPVTPQPDDPGQQDVDWVLDECPDDPGQLCTNPDGEDPEDEWMVGVWIDMPPRRTIPLPLRVRAWAWLKVQLTWPWIVRDMKAQGYRRTGWRTWGPGE